MSYIYAIQGPPGSGKSSFGLSFPGKVFIFDLEYGAQRALWRVDKSKYTLFRLQPDLARMTMVKGDLIVGESEKWDIICTKYVEVLQDTEHTAIQFDTHFKLWQLDHRSELQRKQEAQIAKGTKVDDIRENLQPIEYGTPNAQMQSMLELAQVFGKDLILVNHEKPIYITTVINGRSQSVASGEYELEGWSKTASCADWQLKTKMVAGAIGGGGTVPPKFNIEVMKSPVGAQLVGMSIENPDHEKLERLGKAFGGNGNGG